MKRLGLLAGVLVLVGIFGAGVGLGQLVGLPDWSSDRAAHSSGNDLRRSTPKRISIPAIGVRAEVVPVGLARDGTIDIPADRTGAKAGWYSDGPTPGEYGPAVLVGHVDTASAPAVFHSLSRLTPGKLIEVSRRDRKVAVFRVDTVETYPKEKFPAEKVFTDYTRPRLVLVTCGGRWVGGETGYADNVIVFASLRVERAPHDSSG